MLFLMEEIVTEDRISNLPDTLIQHILSFLATKCAVSTSILSSRWRNLWTSVPVLDFWDESRDLSGDFTNFVERVLLLHNRSNVHKFSLTCYANTFQEWFRINSWITSTIIKCKLQHLNLRIQNFFYHEDNVLFPHCLFVPELLSTITTLNINTRCTLKIPSSVHFPKLKVLRLQNLDYFSDKQEVRFDFPILEDLALERFQLVNITTITICGPRLKSLTIMESGLYDPQYICQIKVYGKSLISLSITSGFSFDFSMYNLPSLLKAYIAVSNHTARVTKIFRAITHVKDLKIANHAEMFEALALPREGHSLHPLTLMYVTSLTIYAPCLVNFRDLISFLHILPKLESLHITDEIRMNDEEPGTLVTIPKCLLSHLKSVEIDTFDGNVDELHVVSFFLKNGRVLERMTLRSSEDLCDGGFMKQIEVTTKLLLIPKASSNCSVDIDYGWISAMSS